MTGGVQKQELIRLYCPKSVVLPSGPKASQDEVTMKRKVRLPYALVSGAGTRRSYHVGYGSSNPGQIFNCVSEFSNTGLPIANGIEAPAMTTPLANCPKIDVLINPNHQNRVCGDVSVVAHRCGDGFLDTDHGEDCDPNQADKSSRNGKICNPQTCKFEENGKATFAKTTTTSSVSKVGDKIDWVITVTGDEQKTTYNAGFIDILPKGLKFEGF